MPNETQGLQSIRNLFDPQQEQHLEWSVRLTKNTIQLCHKPTIYVYINKKYNCLEKIQDSLISLHCPSNVLSILEQSASNAWYIGLRAPEFTKDDKVIYIHNNLVNYIHAYRWKNNLEFKKLKYVYDYNLPHQSLAEYVSYNIKPAFNAIVNSSDLKNEKGAWMQENDKLNECYITFSERPKLKPVVEALKNYLSNKIHIKLKEFEGLGFKNIGFDCTNTSNPEITIYFSLPINNCFPGNYMELISMTDDFYNKNFKSVSLQVPASLRASFS